MFCFDITRTNRPHRRIVQMITLSDKSAKCLQKSVVVQSFSNLEDMNVRPLMADIIS